MIIEGSISVKAALTGKKRKINELYIDKNKTDRNIKYIINLAKSLCVKINFVDREVINNMSTGKTHGGIIADVENRVFDDISKCFNDNSFVCLIEGIEDPFNLGYMIRSLYSAGCSGLIFNNRDWSFKEDVILKSSAGAYDLINIHKSECLSNSIEYAKKMGCKCYGAIRKDAVSYFEADFNEPVIICIGGEMRGLSKDVIDSLDSNIYIPYANDFKNALNASSACVVIAYEVLRQRRK